MQTVLRGLEGGWGSSGAPPAQLLPGRTVSTEGSVPGTPSSFASWRLASPGDLCPWHRANQTFMGP